MLASTVYRTSPSFGCANVRDLDIDWSVGGLGDGWGEWMGEGLLALRIKKRQFRAVNLRVMNHLVRHV